VEGDLVYFDPPYIPQKGDFTTYTAGGFGLEDHKRLARVMNSLSEKGVYVILSNSDTLLTWDVYNISPHYNRPWENACTKIMAPRSINRDGGGRQPAKELIITNFSKE
jgi:DNA adenine methylase